MGGLEILGWMDFFVSFSIASFVAILLAVRRENLILVVNKILISRVKWLEYNFRVRFSRI